MARLDVLQAADLLHDALLAQTEEIQEIGLVTEDDQPGERHCPGCRSDNLTEQRWSRGGFVGSLLLLGLPLPIPVRRWRCSRCKQEWRADQLG